MNAYSLIPVRTRKRKRIFGVYRRELARSFDQTRYHQRNKVETVFSVLKRKFGEALKARKFHAQIKELKIKLILYNISKIILAILSRYIIQAFNIFTPQIMRMFFMVDIVREID